MVPSALDADVKAMFYYGVCAGALGFVLNCLLVIAILRKPGLRTPLNIIYVSIAITEMIMSSVYAICGLLALFTDQQPRNPSQCTACGFMIQSIGPVSVFNLTLVSLYLYYRIVLGKPDVSVEKVTITVLSVSVTVCTINFIPLRIRPDSFTSSPGGELCAFNLISNQPALQFYNWGCFVLITMVPILMIYLYSRILSVIGASIRVTIQKNNLTNDGAGHLDALEARRSLVKRAIVLILLYTLFWIPMSVKMNLF
jgi:hypothetical protein